MLYKDLPIRRIVNQTYPISFPQSPNELDVLRKQGFSDDKIFGLRIKQPRLEIFGTRLFRSTLSSYERLEIIIPPSELTRPQRSFVKKRGADTLALATSRNRNGRLQRKFLVPVFEETTTGWEGILHE